MFPIIKEIIANITIKKLFKSMYFFSSLTLAICFTTIEIGTSLIDFKGVIEKFISIIPTFLGALIAGFAILTTFTNEKYLKELVEFEEETKTNLYMRTSAIFAYSIIISILFMIGCIITNFSFPFLEMLKQLMLPIIYAILKNILIFILMIFGFYSMVLAIATVVNIFNWTSSFHEYLKQKKE